MSLLTCKLQYVQYVCRHMLQFTCIVYIHTSQWWWDLSNVGFKERVDMKDVTSPPRCATDFTWTKFEWWYFWQSSDWFILGVWLGACFTHSGFIKCCLAKYKTQGKTPEAYINCFIDCCNVFIFSREINQCQWGKVKAFVLPECCGCSTPSCLTLDWRSWCHAYY